ncbi:MAG: NAD(P)/FAD-dependent oxidoreductase [Verrucomicrobiota bacterium]
MVSVSMATDVIVIGGGVAGLAAAGALGREGWRVVLLEARGRLGGRIFTARPKGWSGAVELGAEFVHSGNRELWGRLKKHRIATRQVPGRHWLWREGRIELVDDLAERIARVTDEIQPRKMRGWSFADFMRGRAESFAADDRTLAEGFVEGFQAAPQRQMSAVALKGETLDDAEQFVVPGGYDRLVEGLERELPRKRVTVVRGATVTRVAWLPHEVMVRASGQDFVARAAVITLPLGVLQAKSPQRGAVRFEPELREKRKLIAKMGVGQVMRIAVRCEVRRWRALLPPELRNAARGGIGFIHSQLEGMPVWWSMGSAPVLTGWAGGPAARALRGLSDAAIFERALASLAKMLGVSKIGLRGTVADWQLHNWMRDPFSRGAYSFTAAGQDDAAERLREPVRGTLFFAGEATADGEEIGTVHGALASGLRAAEEVCGCLAKGRGET